MKYTLNNKNKLFELMVYSEENIMELVDKNDEYLVAVLRAFMTALILSGTDFDNLKRYSLSKWFRLSQTVDNSKFPP